MNTLEEAIGETSLGRRPSWRIRKEGIKMASLAGPHGRLSVDNISHPAPGLHHLLGGLNVELAGDIEVVVALVGLDGQLELFVEGVIVGTNIFVGIGVGGVGGMARKVSKMLKILFEFVYAFDSLTLVTPL